MSNEVAASGAGTGGLTVADSVAGSVVDSEPTGAVGAASADAGIGAEFASI